MISRKSRFPLLLFLLMSGLIFTSILAMNASAEPPQRVVASYSGSFWSLQGDGLPKDVVVSRSFYLIHPLKTNLLWESRTSDVELQGLEVFEFRRWQLLGGGAG